ncbi:MAG: DUF1501 domain-containing protein [bacterium]
MKRREFIQIMMPIAGLPLVWPMWSFSKPLKKFGRSHGLQNFPDDGRVLVLVQLAGGNDGMNTVIPFQNDIYYQQRPQLAIPKNEVITLDQEIGLHPAMAKFKTLLNEGSLGIVQGVGYPQPNRSHFRSTDIWLTGSSSEEVVDTGWLGRYFDLVCPEGEECGTLGPPAIQIGLTSSLALLGREQKGIALQNPVQFYNLARRLGSDHEPLPIIEPTTPAERELEFLRETEAAAFQFAGEIVEAYEKNENKVPYQNDSLSQQLAIVARLIAGGLSTRIYIVSLRGFDTHAFQANTQRGLLEQLTQAVHTFQKDIEQFGLAERVAGFCFSEFGRRVKQNASQGTDHGTAAPMFFFGKPVIAGVHNPHPSLTDLDDGDLKFLVDFRQIYASLIEQWLVGDAAAILGSSFTQLNLIDQTTSVRETAAAPKDHYLQQNYPNPFNPQTTIKYGLARTAHVKLVIHNSLGQQVSVLVDETQNAGRHEIVWQANGHASGVYFLKIQAGEFQQTRRMMLVK